MVKKETKSGAQLLMDKYKECGAIITNKSNGKNQLNSFRRNVFSKKTKRTYDVEPTVQQKAAAEAVLAQKASGKNINYSKALKEAKYSESIQKSPGQVTKSKGFRAYLAKYDLTENSIAGLIRADIDALGPGERFNYIKMAAGMLGMLDPN